MTKKNNIRNRQNTSTLHEAYAGVQRATAYSNGRTYIDVEPSRSVRPSFTKQSYTAFRGSESVPTKSKEVIKMCMEVYDNVGLVRHIIDLMGDFACQGMSIVHEDKKEQNFYRRWFTEVKGQERSERFLNFLYRSGNVFVRRTTAKITPTEIRNYRAYSAKSKFSNQTKVKKNVIPWNYEFLNPLVIDVVKEDPLSLTEPTLYMNIRESTLNSIDGGYRSRMNVTQRKDKSYIKLDDSVMSFHYKKDDWLLWANPMIRPVLDDIIMLEKMKLADLAALDGAISNVRLWTLGDLEHKIMPKKPAINKLRDVLSSHVGGGTMDLIWGPDLKFTESNTQVYKFLGNEKYAPVLAAIYVGMGIPPSLTGGSGSGLTNNHLSMKTLIERLEYGRKVLLSFWEHELKLVQKAMGFKKAPKIHFTNIILNDEAAVKKLFLDLADRNIISEETLLERFNEIPEIEKSRAKRENEIRLTDPTSVKKASQFHNPEHKEDMAKIALTKEYLDKEYLEKLGLPSQNPPVTNAPSSSPGGSPSSRNKKPESGRPKNTRDTDKRKQRRVIPRGSASLGAWGLQAQKTVGSLMAPIALAHYGKKNLRSLSKKEMGELEYLKLCIFTGLEPYCDITEEMVQQILESNRKPSPAFTESVAGIIEEFIVNCQREPNLEDLRAIYANVFAQINTN